MKKELRQKKRFIRISFLTVLMITYAMMCLAQFSGEGGGTEDDPYLVANATHLDEVRNFLGAANANVHFRQNANIDLEDIENWEPIGNSSANSFRGTFDGSEFTISNLTIERNANYQGLFGYFHGAMVINVELVDVDITISQFSGALVGRSENQTVIRNCSSSGRISGVSNIGGLVGQQHNSRIERSFSRCYVSASNQLIGGLLGHNHIGGVVSECYATGVVTGGTGWYTGGLVGYNQGTRDVDCGTLIEKSYSTGFVTGPNLMIGGLVGRNFGSIVSNCYSTASVLSFGSFSGCLIGQHCCSSTLIHSFAVGSGDLGCAGRGGLMCQQQTSVTTNSYWDRQTTGQNTSAQGTGYTTAQMLQQESFVGWDFEEIWTMEEGLSYPSFRWDEDQMNIPGPTGLQAEAGSRIIDLTWNALAADNDGYRVYLDGELVNEDELIDDNEYRVTGLTNMQRYAVFVTAVLTREGQQYETLPSATVFATPFGIDGEGTEESPFIIRTADELNVVVRNAVGNPNIFFEQGADIDLEDIANWEPIGIGDNDGAAFRGKYNGAGFEIRNMTITGNAQYRALFGFTRSGAVLRNIHLVNANVRSQLRGGTLISNARDTQIIDCSATGVVTPVGNWGHGGLIGDAMGNTTVTRCWADVNIAGATQTWLGGLIGRVSGPVNISQSFALGNVSSTSTAQNVGLGGLIGTITSGSVSNSYAMGDVTSTQNRSQVGGLIGVNSVAVTNSFSTGRVTSTAPNVGGLIGSNTGAVTNSYWDIDLSAQRTSAGGTGLSTADMLDQDSYENWDFTEEPIWRIEEGSLPYLAWEGDEANDHSFPPLTLPPSNVAAAAGEGRITVTWNAVTLLDADGYRVYRDGNLISGQNPIDALLYHDDTAVDWTPYYYSVTAVYTVEGEVIESARSAEVFGMIHDYAEGDGSAESPFTVASETQLNAVRQLLHFHFIQTAHIDLSRQAWEPIGDVNNRFQGSYNGNDFDIIQMNFNNNSAYQGLFAATRDARLTNISLVDVNLSGGQFTGALAGRADNTTVNGCSSSGTVNGSSSYVGGLFGYYSGTMSDSHSSADVEGTGNMVGGLIGDSWGTLHRCFATGDVSGANQVGGLAGYDTNGSVNRCFATGNVEGTSEVGGLLGRLRTSRLNDSFATGNVTAQSNVGGLVGMNTFNIYRSYSIGRVTGQQNAGGLVGARDNDNRIVENSYWNVRTSGQEESVGGEGRDERHMTHPYTDDTYVGWDFNNVWEADVEGNRNRGYPFFEWMPLTVMPYPYIARNPNPANGSGNVSVELDSLRWVYLPEDNYSNPIGFRVYFSDTEEFDEDFDWVVYHNGQQDYATSEIIPDSLNYLTTYYWKVVPTVTDPDDDGDDRSIESRRRLGLDSREVGITSRGDAEDVPVWRFTTQINPHPASATTPIPEDGAEDVAINLTNVGWTYTVNEVHTNPAGFRIYMNTTGEFEEDDDFVWVNFSQHQSNYTNAAILPEQLEYNQTYYWKVVPTTENPNRGGAESRERRAESSRNMTVSEYTRNDAEDVTVWSFTTIATDPNPQPATNPDPEHLATGISLGLAEVSWDYQPSEIFADPVGFRVYMNTTGAFGVNAPYIWVDYVEDQVTYSSSDILPLPLDANTTYYWRVIPTTIHPDDMRSLDDSRRRLNDKSSQRQSLSVRGDAQNCPVWRFTTGTTDIEGETVEPPVTELQKNYPNPFNPETNISFALAEASDVTIEVYNSRGQKVITLFDGYKESGRHTVVWNGRDSDNREVGSGIYFYRMKSGSYTSTNRMVLLK